MTDIKNNGFENFLRFVNETQPYSVCLNHPDLQEVYDLVNDIYNICSILIDHEYVKVTDNYYSLLIEYRDYYGRFLLTMTLNDEYLVNSLFRLLVEKLYRIIFGFYNSFKSSNSVRRHSRYEMSTRLTMTLQKKKELDDFYSKYSDLIHQSIKSGSENLDLRSVYSIDRNLIDNLKSELQDLNSIFLLDYFKPFCVQNSLNDLSFIIAMNNRISENTKKIIKDVIPD